MQRGQRQALFSGDKTSGNGHNLKLRRLLLYIKKILYCEDDQAHAQVVQRICEVSVLGDMSVVQERSWVTGSRCVCLSRSVGPASGGPLESLALCDSVKFMRLKEPRSPISPNGLRSPNSVKMTCHKVQHSYAHAGSAHQLHWLERGTCKRALDLQMGANLTAKAGCCLSQQRQKAVFLRTISRVNVYSNMLFHKERGQIKSMGYCIFFVQQLGIKTRSYHVNEG